MQHLAMSAEHHAHSIIVLLVNHSKISFKNQITLIEYKTED
jgi:hypothetical protein